MGSLPRAPTPLHHTPARAFNGFSLASVTVGVPSLSCLFLCFCAVSCPFFFLFSFFSFHRSFRFSSFSSSFFLFFFLSFLFLFLFSLFLFSYLLSLNSLLPLSSLSVFHLLFISFPSSLPPCGICIVGHFSFLSSAPSPFSTCFSFIDPRNLRHC